MLAGVLLTGALIALGLTTHQATAQDNPNAQPSASKDALSAGSESFHTSATLKKVLWAVVNRDGTLARGRGALRVNKVGTGAYEVLFDRNVRKCVYTATIGLSGSTGGEVHGQISVVGLANKTNGVYVETADSGGGLSDRGFHLALNCPAR